MPINATEPRRTSKSNAARTEFQRGEHQRGRQIRAKKTALAFTPPRPVFISFAGRNRFLRLLKAKIKRVLIAITFGFSIIS
jgi:hypothetical protein